MRRHRIVLAMVLLLGNGPALAAEPMPTPTADEPNAEELEIIAEMETLRLMDLTKSLEVVKEMDVLLEEELDEIQK